MNTNPPALPVAVVVLTGPGSQELTRLDDLLDSFHAHAAELGPVIISNDGNDAGAITAILRRHGFTGQAFANPRAGRGPYWMGRLTFGLAQAYAHLRQHFPEHHVLRIDSDALVIRPFHSRLASLLAAHPSAGLIGSENLHYLPVEFDPSISAPAPAAEGERSRALSDSVTFDSTLWHRTTYRMSKRAARWGKFPFVRQNLFGANASMRRLLMRAKTNGYDWGKHVNGGAYVLTAEANRRLGSLPELTDPGVIANDWVTEDVFFAIAVHAAGLRLLPQQAPGDLIASCWKGLVGANLDEVMARDNCVIHSVKDWGHFNEKTTREYFRSQRI